MTKIKINFKDAFLNNAQRGKINVDTVNKQLNVIFECVDLFYQTLFVNCTDCTQINIETKNINYNIKNMKLSGWNIKFDPDEKFEDIKVTWDFEDIEFDFKNQDTKYL